MKNTYCCILKANRSKKNIRSFVCELLLAASQILQASGTLFSPSGGPVTRWANMQSTEVVITINKRSYRQHIVGERENSSTSWFIITIFAGMLADRTLTFGLFLSPSPQPATPVSCLLFHSRRQVSPQWDGLRNRWRCWKLLWTRPRIDLGRQHPSRLQSA